LDDGWFRVLDGGSGWHIPIGGVDVSDPDDASRLWEVGFRNLQNNDIICISSTVESIKGPQSLNALAYQSRGNRSTREKIRQLADQHQYVGYRRIRGDGNCYYRSVIYGVLEQAVIRRDTRIFR
jgi:Peptidase C65 Otubain